MISFDESISLLQRFHGLPKTGVKHVPALQMIKVLHTSSREGTDAQKKVLRLHHKNICTLNHWLKTDQLRIQTFKRFGVDLGKEADELQGLSLPTNINKIF